MVWKLDRSVNGWGWESVERLPQAEGAMVCLETSW